MVSRNCWVATSISFLSGDAVSRKAAASISRSAMSINASSWRFFFCSATLTFIFFNRLENESSKRASLSYNWSSPFSAGATVSNSTIACRFKRDKAWRHSWVRCPVACMKLSTGSSGRPHCAKIANSSLCLLKTGSRASITYKPAWQVSSPCNTRASCSKRCTPSVD